MQHPERYAMTKDNKRKEKDSLGTVHVPENAYYGAGTQRAIDNFPISGLTFSSDFIHTIALVKKYAATVNKDLDILDEKPAKSIIQASQEVVEGTFDDQFGMDIFQTGSGTSINMNVNEVIATRANELLTQKKTADDFA